MMENKLTNEVIQDRVWLLCRSDVKYMNVECDMRVISTTRCGYTVVLMKGLLKKLTE